jgi:pimeloyl-ACP methyl ester carboxylesterase
MDFLDSMRLRSVAVLGLRSGGLLACELAAARPANVARVVLLGTPTPDPAARQADGASATQPQSWAWQAARQYPWRERIAKLSQPLLLLRAADEPPDSAARVRELLPAARSVELRQPAVQLFAPADALAAAVRELLHVT